jgi:hypothetical protein
MRNTNEILVRKSEENVDFEDAGVEESNSMIGYELESSDSG